MSTTCITNTPTSTSNSPMSTITNTPTSTSNSSSKRKSPVQGRQDQIKSRMLEMAEEEHKQKMKYKI